MPNWVTNVIVCPPGVAEALTVEQEGKRIVDFSAVIPTPLPDEEYQQDGMCGHQHPFGFSQRDPHWKCWYSWNREFWGTKWNACDSEITALPGDLARVRFDTAWSHPLPVVYALSEKFPGVTLHVQFADEDLGQNQGEYEITDGNIRNHSHEDGSPGALEHATQLKYGQSYAELQAEMNDEPTDATTIDN